MSYMGDYNTGAIVRKLWSTSGADGSSITRATDGTLKIYKDGSATQRTSLSGVTQTEDFDGDTGVHYIAIDLSDNTDAGFYAAGHDYDVVMSAMTIDGKTVNAPVLSFSIENRNIKANVTQMNGSTTPITALASQYDGTGLVGDTYPARQDQIAMRRQVTKASGTTFETAADFFNGISIVGKVARLQATAGGTSYPTRIVSSAYDGGTDTTTVTVADTIAGANGGSWYLWIEPRPGNTVDANGRVTALDSNGAVFDSTAVASASTIATAVWAAATRSLTSFNPTTVANPFIATKDLAAIPTASAHAVEWTIVDRLGNAVSLSGKTVRCVFGLVSDAGDEDDTTDDTLTASFAYETSGSGIVVSGTGSNIVTLTHDVAKTATAGQFRYWLWNTTDKRLLVKGLAFVEPALQAV